MVLQILLFMHVGIASVSLIHRVDEIQAKVIEPHYQLIHYGWWTPSFPLTVILMHIETGPESVFIIEDYFS